MRTWYYAINPTHGHGSVHCIEQPWWLHVAEWLSVALPWSWMFKVPLPDWPRMQWKHEEPGDLYTPREYWGSVGELLFAYWSNGLFQWVHNHRCRKSYRVEVGYRAVRDGFYRDDPEWFDQWESEAEP